MSTNGGMQLACCILLFLLIFAAESSIAYNGEQKYELDLIHEQMGFLMDENRIQNHEIALLKEMVGGKGGNHQPIVAKEQQYQDQQLKTEDSTMARHHYLPEMARNNNKRPARLLPAKFLYGERKNETEMKTADRFYGPPTNCSDLVRLGYTLNGFYTVTAPGKGSLNTTKDTSQLETVYCAFKQPEGISNSVLEKRIPLSLKLDTNDRNNTFNLSSSKGERLPPVKPDSATVAKCAGTGIHFHVSRRRRGFTDDKSPYVDSISFDDTLLNMGGGMVMGNGRRDTFASPKSGIYQFFFTIIMESIPRNASSVVSLHHRKSNQSDHEPISKSNTTGAGNTIAIGTILKLGKGDNVFLLTKLGQGYQILEASFSGSLLEAEDYPCRI